jgi:cation transport ATPase
MKNITLHVSGTHCAACKIFIEDALNEQIGIKDAHVDLKRETVSFDTDLDDSQQKLAEVLTEKIKHNGYELTVEKQSKVNKNNGIIWQALPIGLAFLALFFFIQKSGILNFGLGGCVVFCVFSTCVCGFFSPPERAKIIPPIKSKETTT